MFSKLTLILSCCLVLSSCFFKDRGNLDINFSTDSTKIEIKGIEDANLFQLQKNLADTAFTATLLNVAVEDDGLAAKDNLIEGSLEVKDKMLVFTPQQPFVKGTTYVVQTVLNSSFGKTKDILKAELGHTPKLQEKRLKR